MTSIAKWTPRIPIVPKHNIISSDFTNTKPFVPAYDKEPEDMQMIMSNSYAKKWHQEKTVFKKRIQEEKIENEVFLMRRYVIRGLNKKVQTMEALKAVPSRIKVGKKVPYAVRLLPKDTSRPPSRHSTQEPSRASPTPSLKNKKTENRSGLHVSIEDEKKSLYADPDDRLTVTADVGHTDAELKKVEDTCNHVHVERKGNKFVVHRVACEQNHHHGCDCTEFDPEN